MIEKSFRVSSALKNIIGKDLITNDFIAVFELVKNAFDAHATRVDVTFRDLHSNSPSLVISDNGKGMDLQDLENKWLFVAYSAKKDGTEDYRDSIESARVHAGAKGIGRFSCDKLGSSLKIFTKKSNSSKLVNLLTVDWEDFEADSKAEFEDINVSYETTENNLYNIKTGTVLEIQNLREVWDKDKLIKLRRSLEKLINPNQDNDADNFSINLTAPDYIEHDSQVKKAEPWRRVNGPVQNFLFEKLGLKTTFITVSISESGDVIETRLEDRGTTIFELKERNRFFYDDFKLSNITVSLFALNRSAKRAFTTYMGTQPVNFGSVFVYKNGFRVHPVGDYGDDSLGLDSRKTQGTSRYLGSRDVLGRIEINGKNPNFMEASSRDGGLVKNDAYECLREFFESHVLKRLEKYAVDIVKYGNIGNDFDSALQSGNDVKSQILSLVQTLTKSDDILDIRYDPEVVDILEELSEQSLRGVLRNFKKIATRTSSHELEKEVLKAEMRLAQLETARLEAEEETKKAKAEKKRAEEAARIDLEKAREAQRQAEISAQETEKKTTENIFLRSMVSKDLENVVSFHHHIGIAAETIENYIRTFRKRIQSGKSYSEETVIQSLENISLQARKIISTTRLATKANFHLEGSQDTRDLCEYIQEYLLNICAGVIKTNKAKKSQNMIFIWNNDEKIDFVLKFRPLEIAIILDNLISNSIKAGATEIIASASLRSVNTLEISFRDNGKGISKTNADKIFDLAYTTTGGSGLGLSHTQTIMEEMKGNISFVPKDKKGGAEFLLKFTR